MITPRLPWRLLLSLLILLASTRVGRARVGVPVVISWDYGVTMGTSAVILNYQILRCASIPCGTPCTPVNVAGATVPVGLSWGSTVASGTWANDATLKTATFTATAGRYIKLVELTEVSGFPYMSAAEITVFNNNVAIPQAQLTVVNADSQEFVGSDGKAQNAIDGNTATIWHTAWFSSAHPPPHQIILDLGQSYTSVNKLTYLPRQDGSSNGMVSNYEVYVASTIGATYTDTNVAGGTSYTYQVAAVGLLGQVAATAVSTPPICGYVRALVRGRPDPIDPGE